MSASSNTKSISCGMFVSALLGCSALCLPQNVNASAIPAKTSWAISRVASASQGSYCTMAQKYADGTVLTFARNTKGEYSLALDFKEKTFASNKKQDVTLRAEGDMARTYSVTPQSDTTAVVGIGSDADIIKKIASAATLKIEIAKSPMEFALSQFKTGQKEMGSCIEALNQSASKPAEMVQSERTGVSSPEPVIKRNKVELQTASVQEPSAEGLLAAMPKPSEDMGAEEVDVKPLVVAKAKAKEDVKIELPSLDAPSDEPVIEKSEKMAEKNSNEGKQLQDRVVLLQEENARLTRAMAEQRQNFENKQSSINSAAVDEANQKLQALSTENAVLKENLQKLQNLSKPTAKDEPNSELKNMVQKLQDENAALNQKLASFKNAPQKVPVSQQTSSVDDESLKLRSELRKLNGQIDGLKTENDSLKSQVTNLQKENEGKQLKMAGGSWDLEQATRRYQESQREIVRLGALLQSKDVQCASEKKDIEYMLFDPAIASKAQIAMLNSLEDQVKEKSEKLKSVEAELVTEKAKGLPDKDAQIAELQKSVLQAKLDLSDKLKQSAAEQDKVIASLRSELDQKNQQLADAQSKAQKLDSVQAEISSKTETLTSLKAEADQKAQQLADAQKQIQQLMQAQQSTVTQQGSLVASLKTEIEQKTQQLTEAQKQIQQLTQAQQLLTSQQDTTVVTLKTQISQLQSQLVAEQAKSQQVEAKVQAQYSADHASSIAALQSQILQANQKIVYLQKQISDSQVASTQVAVAMPVATPAPVSIPAPAQQPVVQKENSVSQPAISPPRFKSAEEFTALLKDAGVSIHGSIQEVKGGDPLSYRAYSWKTDSLYGSAEMRRVSDASQFDSAVNQYLSRAKERCSGEFAAVPSAVKPSEMNQSKAYEIACVGSNSSSSASVLFTYGQNIVTTIAHEGRAEAMDLAIDARDRLSSKIN